MRLARGARLSLAIRLVGFEGVIMLEFCEFLKSGDSMGVFCFKLFKS